MSIKIQKDLLVSSNPDQGALNLSEDGSSFEVKLQDPITIPENSQKYQIRGAKSSCVEQYAQHLHRS
jgi:hypothetical protein